MGNAVRIDTADIPWPEWVALPAERVLAGNPLTSTVVVDEAAGRELGLWKSQPGAFATDHVGYIEYGHILSGSGRIIDDAGTVTELGPDITVFMPLGWKGKWVIDETIVKAYTIIEV